MPKATPPRARALEARRRAATARRLALVIALLLWGGSDIAQAARRVVVMPFSGPRGGAAAASIRRALRGYRQMPAGAYARAARAGGHLAAARRYRITAVVKGKISRRRGRWMLRVSVISGTGGTKGSGSFRLRGARIDRRTASRVASSLRRWIRNCQAPGGAARPRPRRRPPPAQPPPVQPPPAQPPPAPLPATPPSGGTGFDDGSDIDGGGAGTAASALPRRPKAQGGRDGDGASLGFEVGSGGKGRGSPDRGDDGDDGDDESGGDERDDGNRRSVNARPPWESIFEVGVGVSVLTRSFAFNDQSASNAARPYGTPPVSAIYARGAFYPGAFFTRSVLADFGVVAHFSRIMGLKSEIRPKVWIDTFAQTFEIGLRHRWNVMRKLKSPVVRSTVQFGNQQFLILDASPPLPDISYNYLKLGAGVDWIYFVKGSWHFGASLDAYYLYVFSSGPIENADSTGYGGAFTGAIDGSGGVFVRFKGFSFHVEGFYRRFFYSFDMNCAASGCNLAGGALDIYGGVTGLLGYTF